MLHRSRPDANRPTWPGLCERELGRDAAAVKDDTGLPWGCVVQPLHPGTPFVKGPTSEHLLRCKRCFSYVHWLTRFNSKQQWVCSFCQTVNPAEPASSPYGSSTGRQDAAELRRPTYESDVVSDGAPEAGRLLLQAGGPVADRLRCAD